MDILIRDSYGVEVLTGWTSLTLGMHSENFYDVERIDKEDGSREYKGINKDLYLRMCNYSDKRDIDNMKKLGYTFDSIKENIKVLKVGLTIEYAHIEDYIVRVPLKCFVIDDSKVDISDIKFILHNEFDDFITHCYDNDQSFPELLEQNLDYTPNLIHITHGYETMNDWEFWDYSCLTGLPEYLKD